MRKVRHWPLYALRIITPRLELRLPDVGELDALAGLAAKGVHDPDEMPFGTPWTDAEPAVRARSVFQYHFRTIAEWTEQNWTLQLAVFTDGQVVGAQGIGARDFAVVRHVSTGSWLGRAYQSQGIGTEMRAAVLHLAFEGLGALTAGSGAYTDNPASLAVSTKLGYQSNGTSRHARRGKLAVEQRLLLDHETWQRRRNLQVRIDGLDGCLSLFGITDPFDRDGHYRRR